MPIKYSVRMALKWDRGAWAHTTARSKNVTLSGGKMKTPLVLNFALVPKGQKPSGRMLHGRVTGEPFRGAVVIVSRCDLHGKTNARVEAGRTHKATGATFYRVGACEVFRINDFLSRDSVPAISQITPDITITHHH